MEDTELSPGLKSSKDFFDIDHHMELLSSSDKFRQIVSEQRFEKGRKLYLEIDVEDPEATFYLFQWIYGHDSDGKNLIPFGCKLETIHFTEPGLKTAKEKLIDFINTI